MKVHVQSFLQGGNKPKRVKSRRGRDTDTGTDNDYSDNDRRSRATTPGKGLLEDVKLKPPSERTIKNRLDVPKKEDASIELKNHFRDFMKTPATVKRGRSFSQPRDKEGKGREGKEETTSLSRKESFTDKYTREIDTSKIELENHAKRFLQRRSLIRPPRQSDNDSDNDSLSASFNTGSNKTVDKDCRDSSSEDDLENSSSASHSNIISYKPPLKSAPTTNSSRSELKYYQEQTSLNDSSRDFSNDDHLSSAAATDRDIISEKAETEPSEAASIHLKHHNNVTRSSDRVRSKSAIVPPTSYDVEYDVELNVEQILEDSWGLKTTQNSVTNSTGKSQSITKSQESNNQRQRQQVSLDVFNGQTDSSVKEKDENNLLNNAITTTADRDKDKERQRIRKNNVYSNSEYVYVDANSKIGNSKPRPFTMSHNSSQDNTDIKSPPLSRQNSLECQENNKYLNNSNSNNSYGVNESNKVNSLHLMEQLEKGYSKMYLGEDKENRKYSREKSQRSDHRRSESKPDDCLGPEERDTGRRDSGVTSTSTSIASSFTARTTEILNACKNDIKKLTYRKIYMRTRSSDQDRIKSKSVETDHEDGEKNGQDSLSSSSVYTKYSSGSRIPNRPTTPGPYLTTSSSSDRSPYIPNRPTTPGPFTRESWKRTNKKFNYTHLNKYSSHETFV